MIDKPRELSRCQKQKFEIRSVYVFVLLFFFIDPLGAGIEFGLKPAPEKGDNHSIRNIDFIYLINLDQRPEKFASCQSKLAPYGIHPYRFSAVNGWELSSEVLNRIGVHYQEGMMLNCLGDYYDSEGGCHHEIMSVPDRSYFCYTLSRGAIGIVLSHLSVLQDAYESGYETIWVMEDDIEVIKNPHRLSEVVDQLDALVGVHGWDVLFTDRDTKGKNGKYVICRSSAPRVNFSPSNPALFAQDPLDIGEGLKQVFARYGAYSMIIRRSGIKKLLEFFKTYKVFLPYDMDYYLPEGIRLYGVIDDIVSTEPNAISDNSSPNYRKHDLTSD